MDKSKSEHAFIYKRLILVSIIGFVLLLCFIFTDLLQLTSVQIRQMNAEFSSVGDWQHIRLGTTHRLSMVFFLLTLGITIGVLLKKIMQLKDILHKYVDLTEQKEYRDYISMVLLDVSDAKMEFDLTQDKVVDEPTKEYLALCGIDPANSYEEIQKQYAEKFVEPAFQTQYCACFSIENLLQCFVEETSIIFLEYKKKINKTDYGWFKDEIHIFYWEKENCIRIIQLSRNIQQIKNTEKILRQKAEKDLATGLYNKEATTDLIIQYLASNSFRGGALYIVDIDDFKQVNDTYGHLAGDVCIKKVADILSTVFRKEDIIGRIGGDEFLIYACGITQEKAVRLKAETLIQQVKALQILELNNTSLSISVGAYLDVKNRNFKNLYKSVDKALYQAKNHGKGRCVLLLDGQ